VYDLALAGVDLPGERDGDWRQRLERLAVRVIETLGGHDDLALVALTRVPTGPHALRILEETLRLLRAGGIPGELCPWAADLLDQFVVSSALERSARLRGTGTRAAAAADLDATFAALSPDGFPTIHALRGAMTTSPGLEAQTAWKLRVLLDGLLAARPA
jgi:hypothetical protein